MILLRSLIALIGLVSLSLAEVAAGVAGSADAQKEAETVGDLIRQLGDPSWGARNRAQRALVERGLEAVRHLGEAAKSADPEIAERAKQVLALVDPLTVRVRVLRIALDNPPRIAAVLDGEGGASSEILLSQRADSTGASSTVVVRSRPVPDSQFQLTVDEIYGSGSGSSATSLHAPFPAAGSFSILKRGDGASYRRIGCHLERRRQPFLLLMQWWSRRPSESAGGTARLPDADVETLVRELSRQAAEGPGLEPRLAAIEVLGLLNHAGAEPPLAAALGEPVLRTAALCGLARLGRPQAIAGLRQILSDAGEDSLPSPEAASGTKESGTKETDLPPADDRLPPFGDRAEMAGAVTARRPLSTEHRWLTQAALVLVQSGETAGFLFLCDRFAAVDPLDIHAVLATLADHLDKAPREFRSRIREKFGSPDLLLQLPWEDPEVEHSVAKLAAGSDDLSPDGAPGRLLTALARALYDASRGAASPTSRPRAFSHLWQKLTAGKAPPELRQRILQEIIDAPPIPQQILETVNWITANYSVEPVPDRELERLIENVRGVLQRTDAGYSSFARSALLEMTRGLALGEKQIPSLIRLLADAVRLPHQSYAQELLIEAERITGQALRRPQRPIPVPGTAPRPALPQEENPADQLLRWLENPEAVAAALARLQESPGGKVHGEPLEYWEFLVLFPERPRRGAAPASAAGPPVVLSAHLQAILPGVRFEFEDPWGNRISHRIDRDPSAAIPRYRLNGEFYIELDLPAFFSRRDIELRAEHNETSDISLGPPVRKPVPERLQRVAFLSAPAEGSAPRPPTADTGAIWRQFLDRFVERLAGGPDRVSRALYIIGELRIKEAAPLLRAELTRTPRLDLATKLFEMGDAGGEEYLRSELRAQQPLRRFHAARTLAQGCDGEGIRELVRLCRSGQKEILANAYNLVNTLDSYLTGCSPVDAERTEVLGALVENLHLAQSQHLGFQVLLRETGSDFGYEDALYLPSIPAQTQAKEEAVRKARNWWESQRSPR